MTDRRLFAAALGFAFAAAWIALGFGSALLCLVGAGVFWIAAGALDGSVDLGDLQRRLAGAADDAPGPRPRAARPARSARRVA